MNKRETSVIHAIGATCVGKGFLFRLLREYRDREGQPINVIGMGDLVRQRMDDDEAFRNQYQAKMADGYLLPDKEMNPMFRKAWNEAAHPHTGQEGFLRTMDQIKYARRMGVLGDDAIVMILNATEKTCHARAVDRAARKPNGKRLDEGKFHERYSRDYHDIPILQSGLLQLGIKVIQLDANRDLETAVFPDFLAIAQATWVKQPEPKIQAIPQRLMRHERFATNGLHPLALANQHTAVPSTTMTLSMR